MESSFAEAVIFGKHTVLGVPLKPFSLWHLMVLEALESPWATGAFNTAADDAEEDPLAEYAQLREAVAICSAGFDPSLSCLDPPEAPLPEYSDWFDEWHRDDEARTLGRYLLDYTHQARLFAAYLRDHGSSPRFYQEDGKGNGQPSGFSGLDGTLGLLARAGVVGRDAWEMPVGLARWTAAQVRLATPGFAKMNIETDRDRAAFAEIARRKAEAVAKHQEGGAA